MARRELWRSVSFKRALVEGMVATVGVSILGSPIIMFALQLYEGWMWAIVFSLGALWAGLRFGGSLDDAVRISVVIMMWNLLSNTILHYWQLWTAYHSTVALELALMSIALPPLVNFLIPVNSKALEANNDR